LVPPSGPQKSFNELRIEGCGYWDSDSIIVKFSCLNTNSFVPARSVPAKLLAPGVLLCKPPKLAETGDFEVAVAMDGKVFVQDVLKVSIFKDFYVTSLSPNLIDGRNIASTPITLVRLRTLGINIINKMVYDRARILHSPSTHR
jgi:hypothetical protein